MPEEYAEISSRTLGNAASGESARNNVGDVSPTTAERDAELGAGLAEYSLLLVLIAVPAAFALTAFRTALVNLLQQAAAMF